MLAYTPYEYDNRVRRYAETLAKRGDQVDVVSLSTSHFPKPVEEINGVTVHQNPEPRSMTSGTSGPMRGAC